MTVDEAARPGRRRPDGAIDARKRDSADKVAAVTKVVTLLGRAGAPLTRATIARLAGVSRSFTYENEDARRLIAAAQARSQLRADGRSEASTAQQEASWRERALNAENHVVELRREVATQRRLVSDLSGRLREPDGTWIERDRDRLREANDVLQSRCQQLVRERDELQRRLDGARANVSRLNQRRVVELFPDGPGKAVR